MDRILFEAESHQDGLDAQHLLECRDNRDTTATAHGQRTFAKSHANGFFSRLISGKVDRAYIALSTVFRRHFYLDISRSHTGNVGFKQF